jgi:hypothetical protein
MKTIYLSLLIFGISSARAQLFKKIGDKVKNDAEWRVRNKADRELSKGIDSLLQLPKKIVNKNKKSKADQSSENSDGTDPIKTETGNTNTSKKEATASNDDLTPREGFVTLQLSSNRIFSGGSILISGQSVKYKNFVNVQVAVSGPSVNDTKSVPLNSDGKFTSTWFAPDKEGTYTVTVTGSDKKGVEKATISVYALPLIQNWCSENIELTKKAYDKLSSSVENVKAAIGSKDKAELEKKIEDVTVKKDKVLKLFDDLNKAAKEIAMLAKSGKNLSPNLSGNLSELNAHLAEQRNKMRQIEEYNDHQPADNTICEYMVMLNEACAAFSVYTNLESRALVTIIGNIQLDKGVPKAVSMVNEKKEWLSEPNDFAIKEPAKIFATAAVDAKSLSSALGVAGFAGDMVQFATDFLLKKYCGVFKGEFQHDYTIEFRNGKGENWWTYGVGMKAVISLRYPKVKDGVNIIKMKGNIEGNGTHFTFFEDVEKDDDFQKGSKGKIEVVPIKTFTPLAVSFATSERDILGFGAIARGLATPAYFNIAIDAEYDVNANKIKLFVNQALVDFTIYVSNKFVFALVGADLLPYIKQMNFPIHPALTTIGSVLRSHNEFDVSTDAKGNLSFAGMANKHLGDKSSKIEHDLNFTVSAKKE